MKRFIWHVAIWLPATAIAMVVTLQATTTNRIVEGMGPLLGVTGAAASLPWFVLWALMSVVLLGVITVCMWAMKGRPRLGAVAAALACAILLAGAYYGLVFLPIRSVMY